jgi:hypothetical protein
MKINISIELPESSGKIIPEVSVKTQSNGDDYRNKPPYKGIMVIKARRVQDKNKSDAREYEFKYNPEEYPETNNISKGVPFACGNMCPVRVNPAQFYPGSKGLLPFTIVESDKYCTNNGIWYPVLFEVFDFEWENTVK